MGEKCRFPGRSPLPPQGGWKCPELPLVSRGEDVNNKWELAERGLRFYVSSRAPGFGRRFLDLLLVPSASPAVLGRAVVRFHVPTMPWWFPVPPSQNMIHGVLITLQAQSAHLKP